MIGRSPSTWSVSRMFGGALGQLEHRDPDAAVVDREDDARPERVDEVGHVRRATSRLGVYRKSRDSNGGHRCRSAYSSGRRAPATDHSRQAIGARGSGVYEQNVPVLMVASR